MKLEHKRLDGFYASYFPSVNELWLDEFNVVKKIAGFSPSEAIRKWRLYSEAQTNGNDE